MKRRRSGISDQARVWIIAGAVGAVAIVVVVVVFGSLGAKDDPPSVSGPIDAATLYRRHCSTCHGPEGQGGIGPQLADGAVVARYPDIDDQIDVMRDGRGAMPPFDDALSEDELRAIAEYERSL